MEINIKDLNKAEVLAAIYNHAKRTSEWFEEDESPVMGKKDAEAVLAYLKVTGENFVDYINGRPIKVFIFKDTIDSWMYDRDNGDGALGRIINDLK